VAGSLGAPSSQETSGRGLSEEEAARRAAGGRANAAPAISGRTLADILRENLLTRFNALLGSLLVVILVVGPIQDAVFGLILVANAVIGIAQELRAKTTLDRLAILSAPGAQVIRDGASRKIPVTEIVEGDLLEVGPGDEVVVDGRLQSAEALDLDESLLTGESVPVRKSRGGELLAGSFVAAGSGRYHATRVGEASYARRLTAVARRFQLVPSELMRGVNQVLRIVTWVMVPTAILLIYSQLRASESLPAAVRGSVAGLVTLVPEGLVLLTSAALALAIIRLGRRRVLVQQLAAVEMLARADVVCLDKTGTLTELDGRLDSVEPLADGVDWQAALAAIARAEPRPNATLRAVAAAFPADPGWTPVGTVAFASDRKWSAVRFREQGWWVLGAPDRLLTGEDAGSEALARAAAIAGAGRRVVLLARAAEAHRDRGVSGVVPAALVILTEGVKAGAADTLASLAAQGVAVKVISGDHPATVAAVAENVGLRAPSAVDCGRLPASAAELAELAEAASVFGRATPEHKLLLVRALKAAGHTVAMIGDGVNDVPALKEADLGIAIGGGSAAARAVSAVVLLDGSFAGLPAVLAEGRRVIGNVEKLASLFFTKTVYALLLSVAVGVFVLPFPFLPRQLTFVSAFTIGIPSVFLALAPSFERSRGGFLGRVLSFAIPTGLVAGAGTFVAYALAVNEAGISQAEERTVATIVISAIGLWVLARLARPLTARRRLLLALMIVGLVDGLLWPPAKRFFDLDLPRALVALAAVGVVALAFLCLEAGDRVMAVRRHPVSGSSGSRS
jgi:cation-transporting P-type ATPase E